MKKKILIITDTLITDVGGSERHIRLVIKELLRKDYEFFVLQLYDRDKEVVQSIDDWLSSSPQVRLFHIPVGPIYSLVSLRALYLIRRLVSDENIHIIMSFHEKADILNALFPGKVFRISNRRDLLINPSKFLLNLRKMLTTRYDLFIAPCQAILDYMRVFENNFNVLSEVVYNGVDLQVFSPRVAPAIDIFKKKGSGLAAVTVSNFSWVKGHIYLLKAIKSLKTSTHHNFGIKFFLVGGDEGYLDEINCFVRDNRLEDMVFNLGIRKDIPSVLTACDFMISPSISEGLSNALIEGIASGLPAIGTDVGGTPEIIVNKKNGFLIPPADIDSITRAIREMVHSEEKRKKMSFFSRQIAEEKFNYRENIKKYDEIFAEILAEKCING